MENFCGKCNKKCFGEVLFAHGEYYHQDCLKCKACLKNLLTAGFFNYENEFYCTDDYQKMFGVSCRGCGKFIEGEAVTIMEDSYHQDCFACSRCRTPFPAGENISFDGNDYICEICIQEIENEPVKQLTEANCAGCGNAIKAGSALLALDNQWHIWCFTCHKCGCLLSHEYMGRDGVPYCEKDYQNVFGVSCTGCGGYITGKVLQAGEKHYHPQCSRCAKCGQIFGEGEEMYLRGPEILHPRCNDEYERDMEENGPDALDNSVEDVKPEPEPAQVRRPPPARPQSVSPPPVDSRKAEEVNNARNYPQRSYQEPQREEKPPQAKPLESYKEPLKDEVSPRQDGNMSKSLSSSTDALSTPAYSARPFGTQKTAPGSISIKFKPSTTVNKWKPPEPKTAPPSYDAPKTTSLYRPSTTPQVAVAPKPDLFKKPETPKTSFKTETTTKYNIRIEEERARSPPAAKEEPTPLVTNGFNKASSVSSDEGAPARPPPPPTRGSSQHWKSRISSSSIKSVSSTSSQETSQETPAAPANASVDARSANRPLSYIDSAAKRTETVETETKRTSTNITIKSVSTSEDAPLPTSLYRRASGRERDQAKDNRKSMPVMADSMDGEPVVMRENGPARTEAKVMNRRSLPSMDKYAEEQNRKTYPVFPYYVLKTSNYKMPKEIDRSCLEAYLAEDEFQKLFKMEKSVFYTQPAWKQRDLKKRASLF